MKINQMSPEQWEKLWNEDPERYKDAYCAFMYDRQNICRCDICPENEGRDGGCGYVDGSCGQQNCWVKAHCHCI